MLIRPVLLMLDNAEAGNCAACTNGVAEKEVEGDNDDKIGVSMNCSFFIPLRCDDENNLIGNGDAQLLLEPLLLLLLLPLPNILLFNRGDDGDDCGREQLSGEDGVELGAEEGNEDGEHGNGNANGSAKGKANGNVKGLFATLNNNGEANDVVEFVAIFAECKGDELTNARCNGDRRPKVNGDDNAAAVETLLRPALVLLDKLEEEEVEKAEGGNGGSGLLTECANVDGVADFFGVLKIEVVRSAMMGPLMGPLFARK